MTSSQEGSQDYNTPEDLACPGPGGGDVAEAVDGRGLEELPQDVHLGGLGGLIGGLEGLWLQTWRAGAL